MIIAAASIKSFDNLLSKGSNQPILISHPSSYVASQIIDQFAPKSELIRFNDCFSDDSIKIDDIRSLTKMVGASSTNESVIVIFNFHNATIEAQNAFLKSLEDTISGVRYIVTTTDSSRILDTTISRCIEFTPALIEGDNLLRNLHGDINNTNVSIESFDRIFRSLRGNIDLVINTVESEENLDRYNNDLELAKKLLSGVSEPISELENAYSDQSILKKVLLISMSIAELKLQNDTDNTEKWSTISKKLINAESMLKSNTNSKAVLDKLVLEL